ncbi:MAG: 2-C-methyl-D-erythritol 2,4-cyclodiphosphate synthase [Prevotella sp.]|nr:2-C-methyl-D-erythritol 2,4-cyclodiphosphate synthase [Prevotella sp.]
MKIRTGFGYDSHRFARDRELRLGGVGIDYPEGLTGHSDADAVLHALCDALLGAAALRDIGYHFPDTSDATLNMDSKDILRRTIGLVKDKGYSVGNVDITVLAEHPRLSPYIEAMRRCIADIIGIDVDNVSVKAKTNERMGFVGREEGIAAFATALITKE